MRLAVVLDNDDLGMGVTMEVSHNSESSQFEIEKLLVLEIVGEIILVKYSIGKLLNL